MCNLGALPPPPPENGNSCKRYHGDSPSPGVLRHSSLVTCRAWHQLAELLLVEMQWLWARLGQEVAPRVGLHAKYCMRVKVRGGQLRLPNLLPVSSDHLALSICRQRRSHRPYRKSARLLLV
jgi:hypothetical protein